MVCVVHPTDRVKQKVEGEENEDGTEIENWSSTHSVKTKAYLQPESVEEVITWPCHVFGASAVFFASWLLSADCCFRSHYRNR